MKDRGVSIQGLVVMLCLKCGADYSLDEGKEMEMCPSCGCHLIGNRCVVVGFGEFISIYFLDDD